MKRIIIDLYGNIYEVVNLLDDHGDLIDKDKEDAVMKAATMVVQLPNGYRPAEVVDPRVIFTVQ